MTQEEADSACPELVIIAHKDHTLTSLLLALSLRGGEIDALDGGSVKHLSGPEHS